jgi:hypothetical protein
MKYLAVLLVIMACNKESATSSKWKLFATREAMTGTELPDSTTFANHSVDSDSEEACRKNSVEFLYYQNHGEERPDFQYKTAICALNCKVAEGLPEGFSLKEYKCEKVIKI